MATTNRTSENLQKLTKLFGQPLGRVPEISLNDSNKIGTIFWADSTLWSISKLNNRIDVKFKFYGPYTPEDAPFTVSVPCDGYAIFVSDEELG